MKNCYPIGRAWVFVIFLICASASHVEAQISFNQSQLDFNGLDDVSAGVTSLMYGPDGRLYVAEYPGTIKILTVQRNAANDYQVTAIESLSGITDIVNHDDDGTVNFLQTQRETAGLTVVGTAANPVIYVTSSDFRIGAGISGGNGDIDLDTNSGIITRFTWNGTAWEVVDLIRGLPRSEENHAPFALEHTIINGVNYLIVAQGGNTNAGAPSVNFVYQCEYALSGAILAVNLDMLNSYTIQTDANGRQYLYDLPTLDDPTRPNLNGITDPNDLAYDGVDVNDPFGGNDGLNQAILEASGPVEILSPGYRNVYDLVVTENGALYATENGANQGWGGLPNGEGGAGVDNSYDPTEPGSSTPTADGELVNNADHLELVTTDLQSYTFGSYYAGHPNPIRANPSGAGLFTAPGVTGTSGAVFRTQPYDPDGSTSNSITDPNYALPANWSTIVPAANPVESDWRGPGLTNPDGPDDVPVVIWDTNTNGIDEYTATSFGGALQGDLIAGANTGALRRVSLLPDGSSESFEPLFISGLGGNPLGVTCNSDTEIFPGTIWAGTLNGLILVLEPNEGFLCVEPTEPEFDPLADYDGDGYTNQDELDNGTDHCNGGSQPNDFDKSAGPPYVSDLNDLDDDNDGILDKDDPLQLGNPVSGSSDVFNLPIQNGLFNDQQGLGGYLGLGMTGLMNNGDVNPNWLLWLDDKNQGPNPDDILGGAAGLMTMQMTSGTANGLANDQEKGFQYGVLVDQNTGQFTISGRLLNFYGPLGLYGNMEAMGGELGIFFGDGSQSNFIKFTLSTTGLTAQQEVNDIQQTPINISITEPNRPLTDVVFYMIVDSGTGQVDLEYAFDGGTPIPIGTLTAQGSILDAIQQANQDLILGLIGTSNTPGVELEGTWDFLSANLPDPEFVALINAGGGQVNYNNEVYEADNYFQGGNNYTNSNSLVPPLYQTERSASTKIFSYEIPVNNGFYTIILHFAEIYWGATGGGSGGVGKRIFDVSMEGNLVLDNYDIYADVGPEVPVTKTFFLDVQDGQLNIDFSALPGIGGIDQPKVSAIKILSYTSSFPPLFIEPISDQIWNEGNNVSLAVIASGGDPNANFTFSISGQPPSLGINPSTGEISGIVDPAESTGGPNGDGIYPVIVTASKPGSSDANTSFIITIGGSCAWQDLQDSNLARFQTRSEIIGDKIYVLGGWVEGLDAAAEVEIYDITNDTWSFGANMPTAVTHMGSALVGSDIWLIGGFAGDHPGTATNIVQIYSTLTNSWSAGPSLPAPVGSGAATLHGNKIHFFGGLLPDRQTDIGDHYVLDLSNIPAGWTAAAPLPNPRNHHSAESLNGLIYAIGGQYGHDISTQDVSLVHAYDPGLDTWTPVAGLPVPRSHFEPATMVHNGKIIIAGGRQGNIFFDEVTEYDPLTDTWQELCKLPEKLMSPVGQVYQDGLIISSGGENGTTSLSHKTRRLTLEGNNSDYVWIDKNENEGYTARHECGFIQAGDKFYLLGGRESTSVEIYDYASDTWTQGAGTQELLSHFQGVLYQGLIWVVAALKGNNFPNDLPEDYIWMYNPVKNTWIQGPEIPQGRKRGSAGLVLYNDKFYIISGNTNGHAGGYVPWFDEYDPATGTWNVLPDAPRARDHFYAEIINNKIYIAGGRLSGGSGGVFAPAVPEVDVYDFTTQNWSTLPENLNLPTPRASALSAVYQNKLLVIGGSVENGLVNGEPTTDVLTITEEFDPISQKWNTLPNTVYKRRATQAIVSGGGIITLAGSDVVSGGFQKNMEYYGVYNPIGSPLVGSVLTAPPLVNVPEGGNISFDLSAINGETGIFIKYMEITGNDAADFSILSGELTNSLLSTNSIHNLEIGLTGIGANRNAVLTIYYDQSDSIIVNLESEGQSNQYILTVNNGTGDGNYDAGTVVALDADPAPAGQGFDKWTGDVATVTDISSSTTSMTMPSFDATVTATYRDITSGGVVWLEDFNDLADGTAIDNGPTAWTSTRDNGLFEVSGNAFLVNGGSSGPGIWTSEVILISGTVDISVDVDDADNKKEPNDYVNAYYVIDGGSQILFGSVVDDINPQTFSATAITGSTIQIIIESKVSTATEFYLFDNVQITGESGGTEQSPIANAGPDQTITLPTNSIVLNGSGNDPDGGSIVSYLWTQQNGPSTATLTDETTANLTASDLEEGSYVFRLTVTDDEAATGFDDVSVQVVPVADLTQRINSGGPQILFMSESWDADQHFISGNIYTNSIAIAGTSNDALYQSERYDSTGGLIYEIPVTTGSYDVNLHFAEIYFGVPGLGSGGGIGSRLFDISIEGGQYQVNNYDIVAAAGGSATAVIETYPNVDVTDGLLTVILTSVLDNAKISGIEVLPSSATGKTAAGVNEDPAVALSNAGEDYVFMSLVPNPAINETKLAVIGNSSEILQIRIFDLSGRLIKVQRKSQLSLHSDLIPIDVSDMKSGVYLMNVTTRSFQSYYLKLLVEN